MKLRFSRGAFERLQLENYALRQLNARQAVRIIEMNYKRAVKKAKKKKRPAR